MSAKVEASPAVTQDPPKKRRRRTGAAGAADDCFACSNRQVKCDRRRPYCSQCLEIGKECSGYKTQLTWGVGVASRGKLRGLSLPVPNGKRVAAEDAQQSPRKRASTGAGRANRNNEAAVPAPANPANPMPNRAPAVLPPIDTRRSSTYNFQGMGQYQSQSARSPTESVWRQPYSEYNTPQTPNSASSLSYQPSSHGFARHSISSNHLQVPTTSYGEHYESPAIFCASSDETAYPQEPFMKGYHSNNWLSETPETKTPYHDDHQIGWGFKAIPTSEAPTNSMYEQLHQQPSTIKEEEALESDEDVEQLQRTDETHPEIDSMSALLYEDSQSSALMIPDSLPLPAVGATPRLQWLINYYANVIAPVIVAFDSPVNPLRSGILQLAAQSDSLQYGIAALSASNIRLRRHKELSTGKTAQSRSSSLAHFALTDGSLDFTNPEFSLQEELHYKGLSIQSLNSQLADPNRRRHDAVLATLLILCLFHACDTGHAKFKTQFFGVNKLLELRRGAANIDQRYTKFFTMMFSWYDAITATINDREALMQSSHLDLAILSDDEWALENLTGCDSRLFKSISRLGRLNLLSQNKPVDASSSPLPLPPRLQKRKSPLTRHDLFSNYSRIDGNGWATPIDDDEPDDFIPSPDSRTQFWSEWRSIRHALETWSLDLSGKDPSTTLALEPNLADLLNISESFRYSALLYTERLVSPSLPSAHPKLQHLVKKSLEFIRKVKSDVYLLWPLFVTGSECVEEDDQVVVRERCRDIQKDSGFGNNSCCLDLLEKIWRDNREQEGCEDGGVGVGISSEAEREGSAVSADVDFYGMLNAAREDEVRREEAEREREIRKVEERAKLGGQGFRWIRAMGPERGDAEYIVV